MYLYWDENKILVLCRLEWVHVSTSVSSNHIGNSLLDCPWPQTRCSSPNKLISESPLGPLAIYTNIFTSTNIYICENKWVLHFIHSLIWPMINSNGASHIAAKSPFRFSLDQHAKFFFLLLFFPRNVYAWDGM